MVDLHDLIPPGILSKSMSCKYTMQHLRDPPSTHSFNECVAVDGNRTYLIVLLTVIYYVHVVKAQTHSSLDTEDIGY